MIAGAFAMLLMVQPEAAERAQPDSYDFSCAASEDHAALRTRIADSYLEDPTAASQELK